MSGGDDRHPPDHVQPEPSPPCIVIRGKERGASNFTECAAGLRRCSTTAGWSTRRACHDAYQGFEFSGCWERQNSKQLSFDPCWKRRACHLTKACRDTRKVLQDVDPQGREQPDSILLGTCGEQGLRGREQGLREGEQGLRVREIG
jgi:hypothetical protein